MERALGEPARTVTGPRVAPAWATIHWVILGVAAIVAVAGALASLTFPFGWDHGLMANIGDTVLKGGMPYRDGWDIKGPLVYLWFAAAQWIVGKGQLGIRVADLAILVWAAIGLGRTGTALVGKEAGLWVAICLLLSHGSLGYFYSAQPDVAMSYLLALALGPLLLSVTRRRLAVAGLVVGLGLAVKPLYLFFVAPVFLAGWLGLDRNQRLRGLAASVMAMALPVGLAAVWFAARGALGDLIDVHYGYTLFDYSGAGEFGPLRRAGQMLARFATIQGLVIIVLAGLGIRALTRRDGRTAALLGCWIAVGIGLVLVQGKFFIYHWPILAPPTLLAIAAALDDLLFRVTGATPGVKVLRLAALVASLGLVGLLAAEPARAAYRAGRYLVGLESAADYYGRFATVDGGYNPADQMAAAAYLQASTRPDERIAVFGYDATIGYLADRPNPSRLGYALPLIGARSTPTTRNRYRQEYLDALADPPAFIVVGLLFRDKDRVLADWPAFAQLLARCYRLDRSFGRVDLYRRTCGNTR